MLFDFSDPEQQIACSSAFGFASKVHLKTVIEKLEAILKAEFGRKRGMTASSFFSAFMRDNKLEEEHLQVKLAKISC